MADGTHGVNLGVRTRQRMPDAQFPDAGRLARVNWILSQYRV